MPKCEKSTICNNSNKRPKIIVKLDNLSMDSQEDTYKSFIIKRSEHVKDESCVNSPDLNSDCKSSKRETRKIKKVISSESSDVISNKRKRKFIELPKENFSTKNLKQRLTERKNILKCNNKIHAIAIDEEKKIAKTISSKNKENLLSNDLSVALSPVITEHGRYPTRRKIVQEVELNISNKVHKNRVIKKNLKIVKSPVKTSKRLLNSVNSNPNQSNDSDSSIKAKKSKIIVSKDDKKSKSAKLNNKVKIENQTIKENGSITVGMEKLDIPVDKECKELSCKAKIYVENSEVFDVMLNQTNLQFNNNKFYIIQLLKDEKEPIYYVWMRWARVGKIGQMKLTRFYNNLAAAKECFMKKFYDKTKNDWQDRQKFEKINGKYDLVQIDYCKKEILETNKIASQVKLEPIESKLEEKLQDLMRIVFDLKEMNDAVSEMKYDNNKVPLGRLTEAQIKAGYLALREIEGLLSEGHSSNKSLVQACNTYYTRIPHDFGMRIPPLIRSISEIKRELELLETLSDIKIALKLINENEDVHVHPLDRHYQNLHCIINLVTIDNPIYQLINDYLLLTHGSTHTTYNLEMLDLFEVRKEHEWQNFDDKGNRMLLWHGSRTTNYGGIISQGLRIAPAEAPVTGHMFGKGIYFADMSTKSANYIYPTRSKNTGFLLLCEVSLGTCNELIKENSRANKLPPNCHSVKGLGIIAPDQSTWKHLEDGTLVPVGIPVDTGVGEKRKGAYVLNYNEYIVYKQNQVKMRFLVKVRFNFK